MMIDPNCLSANLGFWRSVLDQHQTYTFSCPFSSNDTIRRLDTSEFRLIDWTRMKTSQKICAKRAYRLNHLCAVWHNSRLE